MFEDLLSLTIRDHELALFVEQSDSHRQPIDHLPEREARALDPAQAHSDPKRPREVRDEQIDEIEIGCLEGPAIGAPVDHHTRGYPVIA